MTIKTLPAMTVFPPVSNVTTPRPEVDDVRRASPSVRGPIYGFAVTAATAFTTRSGREPAAEIAEHDMPRDLQPILRKRADASAIIRHIALAGLLALGGCAGFTEPMSDLALLEESENCAKSALCRTFIEDRPPVLMLAVNDAILCETNARTAETILGHKGIQTRRFVVRLKPRDKNDFKSAEAQTQLMHTFVAANVSGRWYAVDNGALPFCDRVCRLSEALHGVEHVSGDTRPAVSVGNAAIATR